MMLGLEVLGLEVMVVGDGVGVGGVQKCILGMWFAVVDVMWECVVVMGVDVGWEWTCKKRVF